MEEEDVDYHNLIIKFFAGEISDNELILLKAWLESDFKNRQIFNQDNELWQELSVHTSLEHYKTDSALLEISEKLRLGEDYKRSVKILSKNNFRLLVAASTIAFIVSVGSITLWLKGLESFQKMTAASTSIVTKEGEKAHIFLADSTEIILNAGSTFQYNGRYNIKDRIAKLKGEAFFDVRSNASKPFVVQLDQMSISATGTRFNVFSFDNEDRIETTLEEGEIQVSIKGQKPIDVKSGQQVVYFVHSEKVVVKDVATETYTSWKENIMRFNDTPFEEVLRSIGRKYNVTFEITNRDLLNLKYTATFIDESLEDVMEMLSSVSPITYKIYYRTSVNDKQYVKPRIIVGRRKSII